MKIFSWLVSIVLAIVIASILFVFFSPDYDMRLVKSESMVPAIKMGDMVITGPSSGTIEPGTIVTYQYGSESITHRVIAIEGDTFVTKGDAVEDPDPWAVTRADVQGVYLFKIPYLGYVANFISTKFGWFMVIIIPATILVALIIWDIFKQLGRRKEEEVKVSHSRKKEVMSRSEWD